MPVSIPYSTSMRRTKIVCTIGPSSSSVPNITELLKAGLDVARINFSHGTNSEHARHIRMLRRIAKQLNLPLAIMQDLPGPKERTGKVKGGGVLLKAGDDFLITTRPILGDSQQVSVDLPDLPKHVKLGNTIFLGDGTIKLEITALSTTDIKCKVVTGGHLGDNKGFNVPGANLGVTSTTDEDWKHLDFGIEHQVDFVAVSFVREAEDIAKVRRFLRQKNATSMLIAKIERHEALDSLDQILEEADGIMVARGDLGIEIPIQRVPVIQKQIIQKCNRLGKPVIVATQMLESMVDSPRPTRAEVTDVANAIFDGADAVMLSEETAIGQYPIESVSMMAQVALEAEAALPYDEILANKGKYIQPKTEDAISYAACHTAHQLGAAAIVAFTSSGSTARRVAKYRPEVPILAITYSQVTKRQLALSWGVRAFKVAAATKIMDLFAQGAKVAKESGIAHDNDLVVITGGVPVGTTGGTNLLKVEKV
jgi:pyruvate kinase